VDGVVDSLKDPKVFLSNLLSGRFKIRTLGLALKLTWEALIARNKKEKP
jgi:hypothetical protein